MPYFLHLSVCVCAYCTLSLIVFHHLNIIVIVCLSHEQWESNSATFIHPKPLIRF